jgi:hypothetical protein
LTILRTGGWLPGGISRVAGKTNESPSIILKIRKKMRRNSLIGGIVMTAMAITFTFLSYFTKSIVLEADSVVSFVAALLLFTTEQSDTVQKRVMAKVIGSFDRMILDFAPSVLKDYRLVFVPMTKGVDNVVNLLEPINTQTEDQLSTPFTFTPPGRGLAELALREIGQSNPTIETVLDSLPRFVTGELALATGLEIKPISENLYQFAFVRPVTLDGTSKEEKSAITSITASLVGVLLAHSSKRNITVEDYSLNTDQGNETFIMKIHEKSSISS